MRNRLLTSAAVALTVAATVVAPAVAATDPDDGYKSGYPTLHAIHTYRATTSPAANVDDGYKSGYPQLHAIHTFGPPAPLPENTDRRFHWSDAAIGAGTAAGAVFLAAAAALILSRRTRIAV